MLNPSDSVLWFSGSGEVMALPREEDHLRLLPQVLQRGVELKSFDHPAPIVFERMDDEERRLHVPRVSERRLGEQLLLAIPGVTRHLVLREVGPDIRGAEEAHPARYAPICYGRAEPVGVPDGPVCHEPTVRTPRDGDSGSVDEREVLDDVVKRLHQVHEVPLAILASNVCKLLGVAVAPPRICADDSEATRGVNLELMHQRVTKSRLWSAMHVEDRGYLLLREVRGRLKDPSIDAHSVAGSEGELSRWEMIHFLLDFRIQRG